jgi:restriction system protein
MTLWLVRAGKRGEYESLALERKLAIIEWNLPDLSDVKDRQELRHLLDENYPETPPKSLSNWESQLWPFVSVMQKGDLVAMPLKGRPAVAVGRVAGPYLKPDGLGDGYHARPVDWFAEIPRDSIGQDLRYSLGAFMTVCRIERNDAERRIVELAKSGKDPALVGGSSLSRPAPRGSDADLADDSRITEIDLEQIAADAIRSRVEAAFKGHGLSVLVGAILEAQGYRVRVSPSGPDGGVDILAGKGPLGFDAPRLVVQVKSQSSRVDVPVLRELQGVMRQFGGEQGLLVAWGGVTAPLEREAQRLFFEIRIWDAADVVREMLATYEDLPDDIQASIPLKRLWALAEA